MVDEKNELQNQITETARFLGMKYPFELDREISRIEDGIKWIDFVRNKTASLPEGQRIRAESFLDSRRSWLNMKKGT